MSTYRDEDQGDQAAHVADELRREREFPPYPDFSKEWENGWVIVTHCPRCGSMKGRGMHSSPMFFYEDCEACGYKGELIARLRELVWRNGQLVTDKTTTREPKPAESEARG